MAKKKEAGKIAPKKKAGKVTKAVPKKKEVGKITHFFTNLGVAVIELSSELKEGDKISIEGATTNIQQEASSMQIDRKPVESAGNGQSIGLKVKGRVREGDKVFKVVG